MKRTKSAVGISVREQTLRLNKYLTLSADMSRRAAERLITEGRVLVNGKRAESGGLKVCVRQDQVKLKGRLLLPPVARKGLYFAFNKPEKVLTTAKDPKGRLTVLDFFKKTKVRLFPVGRLDWDSEGLLILTNDGDFTQKVLHPKHAVPKTYLIKIKGVIENRQLARLLKGVTTPFGKKKALFARPLSKRQKNTWIKIIIAEGKNRQLRFMLEQLGCRIIRLRRTALGRLKLGALKKGTAIALTERELEKIFQTPSELKKSLRRSAGHRA